MPPYTIHAGSLNVFGVKIARPYQHYRYSYCMAKFLYEMAEEKEKEQRKNPHSYVCFLLLLHLFYVHFFNESLIIAICQLADNSTENNSHDDGIHIHIMT